MSKVKPVVFLHSKRLYLRPPEEADLPLFVRWINDPEVRLYLGRTMPVDLIKERKWFEELSANRQDVVLVIVIQEGDRAIGNIGLHQIDPVDHRGVAGVMIGESDYWKQGYAKEAGELTLAYAFNTLNLHRVSSFVISGNQASLALHRSLGFVEEGRGREHFFRDGIWHDAVFFGLLRSEWRERQG
ncbi:MAG: GNAT family protein [Candidatus Uhrbacteria bacterium]|nr:GNAT family N-acetyltransferase [Patescibacteria group bacterium]MBU1906669.1 GNAT family N-acetyltransferase [Patescibacteria group bacterium]